MVDTNSESSSAADVDISALSPGAMIGRYEVLAVLGQGSFGITYRARDVQLNREVAIKEYLPTTLAYRQAGAAVLPRSTRVAEDFTWGRDRFVAESRVMASLHHAPGVVRVHDFLEVNGTAYIVMEMLHGDTLEGHIRKHGRLDAPAIERILWPLLEGLEQVHDAGFLHRDVKPANILLNAQGRPTLIDFGASRAAMAGRTVAMTAVFTPGYAAAEQFNMAKQGPWTDIYGVAATLYHAICGEAPPSAFERMLDDEYQPAGRRALAGFPPGLLVGIDAGLAVRAADRPQSIAAWREILSSTAAPGDETTKLILEQRPDPAATVVMRPVPASQPAAPPAAGPSVAPTAPRHRAALYAGAAVALLALAGGGGYLLLGPKPAPQTATAAGPQPVALQDLNVEQLERVLAERRKADAAAVEKRRLEEEARSKADDGTASKKAADEELERVQQQRQKAEEELARLKTEMEERRRAIADQREQADAETRRAAEARRAAEEAAQRKAEAETAALRQAEVDAKRKAEAEAAAKQQADEALARAQAERQQADDEAKMKAEAEAKQKADAEAALANDKKAAEAAEAALRLAQLDRQHVQVALTALGFDTHGTDGVLGPRSREMIANWQKARNLPPTGFLSAPQNQALLKEAAATITRYDAEQKKIEEERKRAEEQAKAKAAVATPAPAAPAASGPSVPASSAPAAAPTPAPDAPSAPVPAQRRKIQLSQ